MKVIQLDNWIEPLIIASLLSNKRGTVFFLNTAAPNTFTRWSIIATKPFLEFSSTRTVCKLLFAQKYKQIVYSNPWLLLNRLMDKYKHPETSNTMFPLGGCFGYWGYDMRRYSESPMLYQQPRESITNIPDCMVWFYDSILVFDHLEKIIFVVSTGISPDSVFNKKNVETKTKFWLDLVDSAYKQKPHSISPEPVNECYSSIQSNVTRDRFIQMINKAKEFIRQGDIYQVNLSQKFSAPWNNSGWLLFNQMIRVSPSSYSSFINAGDFQLISISPELFLSIRNKEIITRPIKGTRPRGKTLSDDKRYENELINSEKENAELIMITDLLRNDLGKICEFGSVTVPELSKLEKFSYVQHLVSTVKGVLLPNISHTQALCSCFPGGSVTGAPKIRATEIIHMLEPHNRGPYTGCIGFLGFNKVSTLSIAIRIAVLKDNQASYFSGAGIVADSDPALEYDETLAKAYPFFKSVELGCECLAKTDFKELIQKSI
jgi:anthranilate/para-aminobenzoate synthase component I